MPRKAQRVPKACELVGGPFCGAMLISDKGYGDVILVNANLEMSKTVSPELRERYRNRGAVYAKYYEGTVLCRYRFEGFTPVQPPQAPQAPQAPQEENTTDGERKD